MLLPNEHAVRPAKHMKARIIRIGNSSGVRIPNSLLKKSGLAREVHLHATEGQIVIRSAKRSRADWEMRLRYVLGERGGERLLDGDATLTQSSWDESEWDW
jgi:antitoxin MazE